MGAADNMDPEMLLTLCTQAVASVDAYRATQKADDRLHALEQARGLVRALEKPGDLIYTFVLSPAVLMALKIAHDLCIFRTLSDTASFVTCEQLAAVENADELLVERVMRVLVCSGFASEQGPAKYQPTQLSRQMTVRTSIGAVESLFMDFLPAFHKTPEFLRSTGYQNPENPVNGSFQFAYQTSLSVWDWLATNPGPLDRFNTYMEGSRANSPHWADYFPVQERLLNGVGIEGRPLLVDIGGGRGQDLLGFKSRFPRQSGRLILEELPSVIDDIKDLDRDIETLSHDFFSRQPVKGARAYYFKQIMHDWSDEHCRSILAQTVAAMDRGFSKVLIEDHILPDQGAGPRHALLDMAVMAWCSGVERTRHRWSALLGSVGLVIKDFWLPGGDTQGIIEAELQEAFGAVEN